jgi:NADH:ubiquinone oxidoreductase subunit E
MEEIDVSATFCAERCNKGPTVHIGDVTLTKATADMVMAELQSKLNR